MGSCHSELSSRSKGSIRDDESSQSTIVSHEIEKPLASTHKTKEPEPEPEPELPLAFGKDVLKEFLLDPEYHNLNHGMPCSAQAMIYMITH